MQRKLRIAVVMGHTVEDKSRGIAVVGDRLVGMDEPSVEHLIRLGRALKLYNESRVDRIVVLSSHGIYRPFVSPPIHEFSAKLLREAGVPNRDIIHVSRPRTTSEEAVGCNRVFNRLNPTEVHIITSDYHMPRAKAIFQAAYPKETRPNMKFVYHKVRALRPPGIDQEPERMRRDLHVISKWRRIKEREANREAKKTKRK